VGIIEQGKMLAFGSVNEIVKQVRGGRHVDVRMIGELDGAVDMVANMPNVLRVEALGLNSIAIEFNGDDEEQAALLATLIDKGYRVVDFRERKFDLEDVFLQVTKGAVN
jgi:ABC-2 type transport system ATP-binding protein